MTGKDDRGFGRARRRLAAALIASALLAGCQKLPDRQPPRANDRFALPAQSSVIAVPVSADLRQLTAALERAVPRKLWTIDRPGQICVPSKKVRVLFAKVKTPTLKCRIVGQVTRGPISLSGAGRDLIIAMPLHATVSAQDIGGILKRETAQADARVRARVRLTLAADWSPRGTVAISYDWTDAPHIDFLGQRITFADKADARLQGVIAQLERTLPLELAKLHVRERVSEAWRSAFTSLELNHSDPPVWMRITPRALSYGGYRVEHRQLTLDLGMTALTESFVGPRPADPQPIPLPPATAPDRAAGNVLFAIPVIADYAELEPVLAKALARRAQRPFVVPGIGPITATFQKVTIYGTDHGRIAVGLTFSATPPGGTPAHGTIWLTARPDSAIDSRRVVFTQLEVVGATDSTGARLLLKLVNLPGVSDTIADSLTQNFSKDYDDLIAKIARAIAEKRAGNLLIRAHIDQIRTGRILAAGQGLYLPVEGTGAASIAFQGGPSARPAR